MLGNFTIISGNATEFKKNSKEYNVNMTGLVRTLHKKDACYYSKYMTSFIPFNSLVEVEQFEKEHNIVFKRCGNCFKQGTK